MSALTNMSTAYLERYLSTIDKAIAESKPDYIAPVNPRTGKRPKAYPMPWMTQHYINGKQEAIAELNKRKESIA